MKKLGKLSINPEKMIRNNELVNLRGGYGTTGCCFCSIGPNIVGFIAGSTSGDCNTDCEAVYGSAASGGWNSQDCG